MANCDEFDAYIGGDNAVPTSKIRERSSESLFRRDGWLAGMFRWITTLLSFLVVGLPAFGQGFANRAEFSNEGSLLQPPREVERLLDQAKESIEKEAWTEATLSLGLLLGIDEKSPDNEIGNQDYFLSAGLRAAPMGSIRDAALMLAESLPDAGMKVFELRYGLAAEQALKDAIAEGNIRQIEKIAGQFSPTTAGRNAAWLTAETKIGEGEPMEAAVWLERLLRQSRAREQFGFGGFALNAACWKAAGQTQLAESTLEQAKKLFPKASVTWGERTLQSDTPTEQLLALIELGDVVPVARQEKTLRWVGGSEDRNGDFPAGVPLPLINWEYWLHESTQHEADAAKTIKQKISDRGLSLVPSRLPVIVPPLAIVMGYDQRINAVHLRTGKLMWTSSFNRIPYDLGINRNQMRENSPVELPIPDYLARRIWGEKAGGQLSSDGSRVYSICERPSSEASESASLGVHARVVRPTGPTDFNVLQAWSIQSEGKLLWEAGGDSGLSDDALAGVLFLGTPIARNDELLILGELNGEVYLFALSPTDGKLAWKQQLLANQNVQISRDSIRRNLSCTPAVAAGQAVCATMSGRLVAMDLGSRTLRWSHRYEQSPDATASQQFNPWGNMQQAEFRPLDFRSSDTSVVITDTTVIHAPSDGHAVYAVHLLTGKPLWEINRSSVLYVGGAWNGRVLIVQDQKVDCRDAVTGESRWEKPLDLTSMGRVAGRGVRNGKSFYLPLTSQEILEIDFETGKVADRMRVKEPLGNLASTSDQILSFSPISLTAYSIRDKLRSEIDLDFAADKNQTRKLLRDGKILLAEGKTEEALGMSEKAYRIDRDDPDAKMLLREIALMALQQDFETFAPRVAEYEELIEDSPERTYYLVAVIEGLLRQGKHREGAERILELSESNWNSLAFGSMMAETIDPAPNLQVRQDIWAAAKLAQFFESASEDERTAIQKMLEPRIAKLMNGKPTRDYGRQSDFLRWLRAASALRMKDAKSSMAEHELLLAEHLMEELIEVLGPTATAGDTTTADELRLDIYRKADRWSAAVAPAERLRKSFEELDAFWAKNDDPKMPTNLFGSRSHELRNAAEFKAYAGGFASWPQGQVEVEVQPPANSLQSQFGGQVCTVKQCVGNALKDWRCSIYQNLIELGSPTGDQRIAVLLDAKFEPSWPPTAHFLDSIAILETQNELIAVDTLRAAEATNTFVDQPFDSVLWRSSFGKQSSSQPTLPGRSPMTAAVRETKAWGELRLRNRKGFVVGPMTRTGILVASDNTLVCLDPRTGSRRWVRTGIGASPQIIQDEFQVVVVDPTGSKRLILDARDGRLIAQHDWKDEFEPWCNSGRHVLSAYYNRRDESRIAFKIWDAFTGETVVESSFSSDIRADVADQKRLVIVSAKDGLVYWDIASGKTWKHAIELPPKTSIKRLGLERFGETLLVFTEASGFAQDEIVRGEESEQARRVRGPMFALNWTDGKPLWDKPRLVYDFVFPTGQLRSTPILSLTRPLKFKAGGSVDTISAAIAMVDLRNGRLLYENNYIEAVYGLDFHSLAKLDRSELIVQYRGTELRVRYTDEKPTTKSEEAVEIGKIDLPQLESQTPKEFLERLQSIDAGPDSGDPFGIDAPNLRRRIPKK